VTGNGEPLALDRVWLPRSLAGPLLDADFSHTGLYDELAALTGTRLTGGSEVITALVPDATIRKLLVLTPDLGLDPRLRRDWVRRTLYENAFRAR